MIGTTAELRVGMELSLEDLFYGMMLPSGNDAAHQIAQMGGTILRMIQEGILDKQSLYSCEALSRLMVEEDSIVGLFIHEMNANSRKIGLTRSSWANPHGLSNVNNLSSAEDVAKLCMYCMKNTRFR
jgi:D-alanyl-D-alanine carboxypeptidase